ncbi:MAG: hypothetical protein KDA45_10355 [Planctomycetales bacterium]|nr:hypothetical protein [Planctomycetales bacterium]
MAVHPQRREDLLVEATAYRQRLLLRVAVPSSFQQLSGEWRAEWPNPAEFELFAGIRPSGAWSLYFDEQPVLQFNALGQLRRLYARGQRYAAESAHLQRLERKTTGGRVRLAAQPLSVAEEQLLLATCGEFLQGAAGQLAAGRFRLLGQIPRDEPQLLTKIRQRLDQVAQGFAIAGSVD